jgi:hypothetical protein
VKAWGAFPELNGKETSISLLPEAFCKDSRWDLRLGQRVVQ